MKSTTQSRSFWRRTRHTPHSAHLVYQISQASKPHCSSTAIQERNLRDYARVSCLQVACQAPALCCITQCHDPTEFRYWSDSTRTASVSVVSQSPCQSRCRKCLPSRICSAGICWLYPSWMAILISWQIRCYNSVLSSTFRIMSKQITQRIEDLASGSANNMLEEHSLCDLDAESQRRGMSCV